MQARDTLVFATNNIHKIDELRAIVGDSLDIITAAEAGCTEDIPEDGDTLQANALQKARYLYRHCGMPCVADDTGLEVDALDGRPGVYTARFAALTGRGASHDASANMHALLDDMAGVPYDARTARFRTVIALVSDAGEHLFEGRVEGHIATAPRGDNGFGYDPVFIPENLDTTFAQMSDSTKNAISHRGRAVRALTAALADGTLPAGK